MTDVAVGLKVAGIIVTLLSLTVAGVGVLMWRWSSGGRSGMSRLWFPICLGILLLLALPGFVLLLLHVIGLETTVNGWLKENLRLSYHIRSWWAALLLLLAPVLVVLLYFLKLRRKPLQVPSTFLWKKSIEDLHVNAFFQWLRNNVLLLLQLLTLIFLIYSMMDWQVHGHAAEGSHYILVIDNSASMNATDVSPSRLERAKEEALRVIDGRADSDSGMVIVFNSEANIVQSYTNDRGLLRDKVRRIQPTQRPTRLDEALSLAASLANPLRSTENQQVKPEAEEQGKERTYVENEGLTAEVHLFSDGRFPDLPEFSRGNLHLHYLPIGDLDPASVDNLGIVTFNAVRDDQDQTKILVLVSVNNYSLKPIAAKIALDVLVDGRVIDTIVKEARPSDLPLDGDGSIPPHDRIKKEPGSGFANFVLDNVDDRVTTVLHARLLDHHDKLPIDDDVWMVLGTTRKANVAVVERTPNRILRAFFNHPATSRVCNVSYLTTADLSDDDKYLKPARKERKWDLVIFDRCGPTEETNLPLANTLFIDAVPPPWKKPDQHELKQPQVKSWLIKDPLLRSLTALYDIGVAEAFKFDLKAEGVPPRVPRLLETDDDVALLFSLGRQSFTDVVMAFPLLDIVDGKELWMTNWPQQPSFPLFLRNVLYVLGNVSDLAGEENVKPGQQRTIRPDDPVDEVDVTSADGGTERLNRGSRESFVYGRTEQVGVYTVKWNGEAKRLFAVNLLDANESNLEPRPAEAITVGSGQLKSLSVVWTARDTWKWVALAAVFLLVVEWFIYNRRIFV
jgi:hypothetical protein